jgi:hypothetical protein
LPRFLKITVFALLFVEPLAPTSMPPAVSSVVRMRERRREARKVRDAFEKLFE